MLNVARIALRAGFFAAFLLVLALGGHNASGQAMYDRESPAFAVSALSTAQGRFIQDLGDKAISLLADKNSLSRERDATFRQMLKESFDLNTIGRFVLGRTWLAATPEQQKEYIQLFEQLVVKTYSERFALYTGEGFRVRAVRPEGERDVIVNSAIIRPDGSSSTSVDWRVRQKDGKLGVIDVVVEGVSMSVTQRQEYASVIERSGGNIEGLLDLMRKRVEDPAKASPPNKG